MNRYLLKSCLGKGGMGVVYEASRMLPGDQVMPVACKILRSAYRDKEPVVDLFCQEGARTLALSHKHPGIVTVYDFFYGQTGELYLIMELVDGCTLADLIDAHGGVPHHVVPYIADRLFDALGFLHDHGLLHRDVSPCNILLSRSGDVLLSDLGSAEPVTGDTPGARQFRGKFAYASPEALRCAPLDTRSDLYSAGSVLYAMLTGQPPFGADVTEPVMRAHLRDWQIPALPGPVPDALRDLTLGLLAREPDERRPHSAAAARRCLRGLRSGGTARTELAGMVGSLYETLQFSRRQTLEVGDLSQAGAVEAPIIVRWESRTPPAGADSGEPDPEEDKRTQPSRLRAVDGSPGELAGGRPGTPAALQAGDPEIDALDADLDLDLLPGKRKRRGPLFLVTLVIVGIGIYALTRGQTEPTPEPPETALTVEQPVTPSVPPSHPPEAAEADPDALQPATDAEPPAPAPRPARKRRAQPIIAATDDELPAEQDPPPRRAMWDAPVWTPATAARISRR